jgi:hypothetical protein
MSDVRQMREVREVSVAMWRKLRCVLSVGLITLSACGGGDLGGGQAGVSSGGTGSFSSGPVRGMGSIVVTGVHFDQRTAKTVTDADGHAVAWQDIDLGMNVEIEGGDVVKTAERESAGSVAIRITSDLIGPVTAIGNDTLFVMGQPVRLDAKTFLRKKVDGAWQDMPREEIALADIVEVHGFQDVTSGAEGFVATRIERRNPAEVQFYVVRGVVEELSTVGCRIGSQRIDYSWPNTPSLRNGVVARALLYPTGYGGSGSNWRAETMGIGRPLVANHGGVRLEGLVTELSGTSFSVNGVPVDKAGGCPRCKLGQAVEVRGELVKSVLRADAVTLLEPVTPAPVPLATP